MSCPGAMKHSCRGAYYYKNKNYSTLAFNCITFKGFMYICDTSYTMIGV